MARASSLKTLLLTLTVVAALLAVSAAAGLATLIAPAPSPTPTPASVATATPGADATGAPSQAPIDRLEVRFLDVGQADAILVRIGDHAMLIDGGNNDDARGLVAYLQERGIARLDAVVGTHPHEDHIGGLDAVLAAIPVGRIYLPRASANTATYEDLLLAIATKGIPATNPRPGDSFALGDARVTVLAPSATAVPEGNDASLVLRLDYGARSFLFTGDAEAATEAEMRTAGLLREADVLKVAHHGSTSSSTPEFLAAVAPRLAVISVGEGNDYGHPAQRTLDALAAVGATVYRTDRDGTVLVTTDGTDLATSFETTAIDGSGR